MNRRTFLQQLAAAAALTSMGAKNRAAGEASGASPRPPNVVIILTDDLGYGDVSCYGASKVKTPNIDRIAREGRLFTDAHSPCATCTPSRYALLSGGELWRRGVRWGNASLLAKAKRTLPALFKEAGYATAAIGKWHLGFGEEAPDWNGELKPGPLEAGFDSFFGTPMPHNEPPLVLIENRRVLNLDPQDPIVIHPPKTSIIGTMSGARAARFNPQDLGIMMAGKAVKFIEENKARPFFLYFATNNVHGPITPNKRFRGQSQGGLYGDFICELDWMVGEVLGTLDRLGLVENTLVLFTSDNGGVLNKVAIAAGHFPNGDLLGQKTDVWEGGHRVPYIVRWPGRVRPGTRSAAMISLSDTMATCAALLGRPVTREECPDSFNILPAWLDKPDRKPTRTTMILHGFGGLALRDGPWLFIPGHGSGGFSTFRMVPSYASPWALGRQAVTSDYTDGGILRPDAPPGQLYDVEHDPNQKTNLYAQHPEVVQRLTEKFKKMLRERCSPEWFERTFGSKP